jgi:hypothetical protein
MVFLQGLKQGDQITCHKCNKHILTTITDIPYAAKIQSKNFIYSDGSSLEFAAKLECHLCGAKYVSISSVYKRTLSL